MHIHIYVNTIFYSLCVNITPWLLTVCFHFLQKSSAPLIPNEHTPDEAKPGIGAGQKSASSPKEEKPLSPTSPNAIAPAVIKESTH